MRDYSKQLTHNIFQLSAEDSLRGLFHQHLEGNPLPSARSIREIIELTRSIIFPGYFGASKINRNTVRYHIGVQVERLFELLSDQISAALCFQSADNEAHMRTTVSSSSIYHPQLNPDPQVKSNAEAQAHGLGLSAADAALAANHVAAEVGNNPAVLAAATAEQLARELSHDAKTATDDIESLMQAVAAVVSDDDEEEALLRAAVADEADADASGHEQGKQSLSFNDEIKEVAAHMAAQFIASLSSLRAQLAMDVKAAFDADPAATSFGEVICCYPGLRAICNYRIAHQLLMLGVPLIPRAITELAHSETGIDIHPGARIGACFSIDHGTGVVIGETCIIGNNVKLYQGVTLGAKTIPVDAQGMPLNIPRHPILEDDVVVYANATILGRITIGKGAIIGGNVWVTDDVKAGGKVVQMRANN